jgi:hypothetical protein
VDITFGDYLRALVTADREAMPDDQMGYRAELIHSFRSRGIRPEGVASYGEDVLAWEQYSGRSAAEFNPNFRSIWKDLNQFEDAPDHEQERRLYYGLWEKADDFKIALGLSPSYKVSVRSLHPLYRVRPDGSLQRQIVAELIQRRDHVEVEPDNPAAGTFIFRGGATVLIDRDGDVRYALCKPIDGEQGQMRLERQRRYLRRMAAGFALAPYVQFDAARDLGFRGVHRGY